MHDEELGRLHHSLYDWAFADIRTAAESLPRLAFVGLAAWIDTLAYLVAGKKDGTTRWTTFLERYLPGYLVNDGARRLYVKLRCGMLHEYGPMELLLTHLPPDRLDVWVFPQGDTLSLPKLIDDFDGAYHRFMDDVRTNDKLRPGVVRRGANLLAPKEIGALSASASPLLPPDRIARQRNPEELPYDGLPPEPSR